ncbi:nucleotidyltransferase domain-containing protein [Streptomyces sp. NBC_00859]|uniref:nucleotidyltransferase domain-containing protein n=1 Tax=Streptomyces sp. NBC_00859 TaxID=2903682 RepID=UPI00386E3230
MSASSLFRVMTAEHVLSVPGLLRRADADVRTGGGWGLDALIGHQTRHHRDVDLTPRQGQEADVVRGLNNL